MTQLTSSGRIVISLMDSEEETKCLSLLALVFYFSQLSSSSSGLLLSRCTSRLCSHLLIAHRLRVSMIKEISSKHVLFKTTLSLHQEVECSLMVAYSASATNKQKILVFKMLRNKSMALVTGKSVTSISHRSSLPSTGRLSLPFHWWSLMF